MSEPAAAPPRPLLLWDRECGFCRRWIQRWRRSTGDRVNYAPYQDHAERFPDLAPAALASSVHLIEPGRTSSGAEAVFRTLRHGGRRAPLWAYQRLPGFAPVSEAVYRWVARHRAGLAPVGRLLERAEASEQALIRTRWLFLRLLGAIFLIAFLSLWWQAHGLMGARGILPFDASLRSSAAYLAERDHDGSWLHRIHELPTLFWLSSSDLTIDLICGAGSLASLALILNLAPLAALAIAWISYLSLTTAGSIFLGFQWDALLLEAGFLGLWLAPRGLRPRLAAAAPPRLIAVWLVRWLAIRLYLLSGIVKLTSGDPSWSHLTALRFHYWTQPLPTWLGYYLYQLPDWCGQVSVFLMFVAELALPLLIFVPWRRVRVISAWGMIALQAVIILSGNYGFFNFLTMVVALTCLDDGALAAVVPRRWRPAPRAPVEPRPRTLTGALAIRVLAALVVVISLGQLIEPLRARDAHGRRPPLIWPARPLSRWLAPFQVVNSYGLFRVMTKSHPEIIFEGSDDGRTWSEYHLPWQPGDPSRRPPFVAPYHPRLDWQLWFAALDNDWHDDDWVITVMTRILQDEPSVLALTGRGSFSDHPPRYLRALYYLYRFTSLGEKQATGHFWERRLIGLYCPILTLEDGRAVSAELATDLPSAEDFQPE